MKSKLLVGLVVAALSGAAAPAIGQARIDALMQQMRDLMVRQLEEALTEQAGQRATIVYVKKLPGLFDEARYCGTARIGGQQKRFVADLGENLLVMEPSQRAWTEASCETNPPNTTILRDARRG